jgi:hypothetical protein
VGQRGHCKGTGLYFYLWKRKRKSSIGNRIFLYITEQHQQLQRVESVSDRM